MGLEATLRVQGLELRRTDASSSFFGVDAASLLKGRNLLEAVPLVFLSGSIPLRARPKDDLEALRRTLTNQSHATKSKCARVRC